MGMSLPEISRIMNIPYDTLYKDQRFLAEQARKDMKNHIADLPFNIKQATDGFNKLIITFYNNLVMVWHSEEEAKATD